MDQIKVKVERRNVGYSVFIGGSILSGLSDYLRKNHANKKIVVITDETVSKLYKENFFNKLDAFNPYVIILPFGEKIKTRETKNKIEDTLMEKKYGRDSLIIAIGGGVIGDLAGFVAATFNRGIPIMHIPTTLLAMIDSSIGGKTGVNTRYGKNLIGSVLQPSAVFADLNFLRTLPDEEFLSGLAEVIKIAITSDKELFSIIENDYEKILAKDEGVLLKIIKRSIELKKEVVEKDETESGLRQTLNFGHTIGHALEAHFNYKIKHGFCVSIGIAAELKISALCGILQADEQRIVSLLDKLKLPTKINKDINADKLIGYMVSDKKTLNEKPHFVLIKDIGTIKSEGKNYSFEVDGGIINKAIEMCKND
ncbi:3-dehydroquinate synthase [Candidatus Woesearchaeota archaeon]|nr:3-dehydroquinate synthase [Candidatus Woesearchaeota archaeon]|tara:strand:+ start:8589 stop:9689 length:1101 start_codon:yes stop_codon:yes gene_type:complete